METGGCPRQRQIRKNFPLTGEIS
ncbi:hypothetical protein CY0110_30935 [Crocosphaera chwakensis CCY0110]|uniref:Uncharacterized protein n=1 Tax=Crocosphaera chwakensis CCY0110 TaxID=391612 RepID=A3IZR9_9CHRO|nr:hypothetical protein CY0110_30935 [Crocosphaera chwakensis CCY0110]